MIRGSRTWLLVFALLVVGSVAIAVVYQEAQRVRTEAREQFYEQYNRQQLLLAEQAANSVEEFFDTLKRNLALVVSLFKDEEVSVARAAAVHGILSRIYESLSDTPIIDLVVFDREGTVVTIFPPDPYTLGRNYAWRDYYRWARDSGKPGQMYVTPFMRMEGGQQRGNKAMILAEGIYGPDGEFLGVAAFPIDFDKLARRHILSVRIGKEGYAWLVDADEQSVLVDPNGRVDGESFRDAFLPRWPNLYQFLLSTLDGIPGTGWYEYEDPVDREKRVRKLVGYQPVRIGERLWVLGVATPEREVDALLSSFLRRQELFSFTLAGAIFGGIALLSLALVFWNRLLSSRVEARTRDLAEARSKLESTFSELLTAKKLAAVGQLALGIVHEIRNPLSAIRMNIQMIRKKLPAQGAVQENFSMVDAEVLRLNRLLNDLLSFARPRPVNLQATDLVEVVERVVRLMGERLAAEGIELDTDLPPRLVALGDAEQIEQIILNLVLNAIEAMEGTGGERRIVIGVRAINGSVEISVGDTGPGVAEEERDKIFDPFYTTKSSGGGLGLSTVQSIVLHHHGSVDVRNRPTGGALFTVRLPIDGGGSGVGGEA
ncbi:MAG: hypothetical protein Kow006_33650 [Gammaproteobacteria bacterium]